MTPSRASASRCGVRVSAGALASRLKEADAYPKSSMKDVMITFGRDADDDADAPAAKRAGRRASRGVILRAKGQIGRYKGLSLGR